MKWLLRFLTVLIVIPAMELFAQPGGWSLSIAAKGNYTTTSRVFYNPDSPSNDIRGQYVNLDNIYGAAVEIRLKRPDDNFFLSFSVEYLSKLQDQVQSVAFVGPPRRAPVTDGFRLIPVEIGANVFIPLGSERVRLSMGGGGGVYFGTRILSVGGVDAPQQNKPAGFGIHVESSFDYRVIPRVAVRGEMRFRDPEVIAENRFDKPFAVYNGLTIPLPVDNFRTRINVNGLSFSLGVVFDVL